MEDNQAQVKLLDIYYESYSFRQNKGRKQGQIKFKIANKYEFQRQNGTENHRIVITTTVDDEDGFIHLDLKTIGIFRIHDSEGNKDNKYSKLLTDTVWPFVRNEVQLLSTQPGMVSIILPLQAPSGTPDDHTLYA